MRYLWKWAEIFLALLLIPGCITFCMNGMKNGKDAKLGVQVITKEGERISAEEYLMGMAATQAEYIQEREAWKAWMIVCRTNFMNEIGKKKEVKESDLGLDYISKEQLEKKNGQKAYLTLLNHLERAEKDTRGQALYYEGELAHALYHEISSGHTLSAKEVFGKDIPYLVMVDSSQDVEAKNYIFTKILTYKDCEQKLTDGNHKFTKDEYKDLQIIEKTEHDYVKNVKAGGCSWTGKQWTEIFDLPSQFFYMERYEDAIRMVCLGKGTGVGMSLYGANVLANRKIPAQMILSYYYPGTEIK